MLRCRLIAHLVARNTRSKIDFCIGFMRIVHGSWPAPSLWKKAKKYDISDVVFRHYGTAATGRGSFSTR
jgi:hypothetical protein